MNKKIKELAERAGWMMSDEVEGFNTRLEKFAELIVRECLKCSDPLVAHYIDQHIEQDQALLLAAIADYSSEIKKHFGVAE